MIELYHFWSLPSARCAAAWRWRKKASQWTSRYIDCSSSISSSRTISLSIPTVADVGHDGAPVRESTIINEYIDAAFAGPALVPAQPLKQARMREFIRKCEDDFDAIVKPRW